MHNDFHPYYVRVGHWTKIDYARSALTWMQPLVRGQRRASLRSRPTGTWMISHP